MRRNPAGDNNSPHARQRTFFSPPASPGRTFIVVLCPPSHRTHSRLRAFGLRPASPAAPDIPQPLPAALPESPAAILWLCSALRLVSSIRRREATTFPETTTPRTVAQQGKSGEKPPSDSVQIRENSYRSTPRNNLPLHSPVETMCRSPGKAHHLPRQKCCQALSPHPKSTLHPGIPGFVLSEETLRLLLLFPASTATALRDQRERSKQAWRGQSRATAACHACCLQFEHGAWESCPCPIEEDPHAQCFGPLHGHQLAVSPDMVRVDQRCQVQLIGGGIALQPCNPLLHRLAESGTDLHGITCRQGNRHAAPRGRIL